MLHDDIERNLVQIKNINPLSAVIGMYSLTTHNMLILSSVAAYNSIHKYDFICISETYFNFSVQSDDRDISING